jgi:hypothetical protein
MNAADLTNWPILSNMTPLTEPKVKEPQPPVDDPDEDKKIVSILLAKFNLSVGDVAQIFGDYLRTHSTTEKDLDQLRSALRARATEEQSRIIDAVGGLLTSEEVAGLLGYEGRQTPNNKKRSGELLSVSFPNRRGDFFPRCQFDGKNIQAWFPELLKRIDGWAALAFLTAKYEKLDGLSYLDVMASDSSGAKEMLEAADGYVS